MVSGLRCSGQAHGQRYLEFVLQQVLLVGQLAVEAEQLGLFGRHFLCMSVSVSQGPRRRVALEQ